MKKNLYVKPSAAVFNMEAIAIMAGTNGDKGDGNDHGNLPVGGSDGSTDFSKENNGAMSGMTTRKNRMMLF